MPLAEAAAAATLRVTAHTGGRAAAGERRQKEKIVVVVVDRILVTNLTESEECMYILYESMTCLLGYLVCYSCDWHDLNREGCRGSLPGTKQRHINKSFRGNNGIADYRE